MADRELTAEEEVMAEIAESDADLAEYEDAVIPTTYQTEPVPSPYQSFANATNQLAQQGVSVPPPTFEEATQALVQQGMPQTAAPMLTQTTMMSPDAASPYAGVADALMALQKPAPLAPTGSYSQDEIGKQMQAAAPREGTTETQNLNMAQQAPEAFNAMIGGMAGTGLQANMPAPLAPAVAPNALQPEIDPSVQIAAEQAQTDIANKQARVRQLQQQNLEAKARHEANIQEAAQSKIQDDDSRAAGQNWGSIIGQGLAVAMGEYGRYLTGGKENLGMKAVEQAIEEKARKEKMTMEEKLAGKKFALEEAQIRLREEEMKTDSQLKRAQIKKIEAEIGQEKAKVEAEQKMAALIKSGAGLTAEDVQALPEAVGRKAILRPDGSYTLAKSYQAANEYDKLNAKNSKAIAGVRELQKLNDEVFTNPANRLVALNAIGKAQAIQTSLKGLLNAEVLGGGPISESEQLLLDKVVADPSKFFSMPSTNREILKTLERKLLEGRRISVKVAGGSLPPSSNDISIAKLKKARPGLSDREAADILMTSGQWKDE